jgi:hypothetical protein
MMRCRRRDEEGEGLPAQKENEIKAGKQETRINQRGSENEWVRKIEKLVRKKEAKR